MQAEDKMDIKKNTEDRVDKSKWYWETDRNTDITIVDDGPMVRQIPDYYKGDNNYTAREVCDNFNLSYHIATATTYLIRAGKKTEEGMSNKDKKIEDLKKAIHHLQFEIQKTINNNK
jgi:hypothetical protein